MNFKISLSISGGKKVVGILMGVVVSLWASQAALVLKNPPAKAGDSREVGSSPGPGRPPGGARGSPLQCSCLKRPRDRGAWRAAVPGVAESCLCWSRRAPAPNALRVAVGSACVSAALASQPVSASRHPFASLIPSRALRLAVCTLPTSSFKQIPK